MRIGSLLRSFISTEDAFEFRLRRGGGDGICGLLTTEPCVVRMGTKTLDKNDTTRRVSVTSRRRMFTMPYSTLASVPSSAPSTQMFSPSCLTVSFVHRFGRMMFAIPRRQSCYRTIKSMCYRRCGGEEAYSGTMSLQLSAMTMLLKARQPARQPMSSATNEAGADIATIFRSLFCRPEPSVY